MSSYSTLGPIPRARVLLGQLTAAMRASRFYPADHPLVQRLVGELLGTLRTFHAEGDEIKLTFHAGEVILGGTVLTEESMLFDQLARELEALGANSITFRSGVTAEELTRLVLLTAGGPDRVGEQGGLTKALERGGGGHIVIAAVAEWVPRGGAGSDSTGAGSGLTPAQAYESALETIREVSQAIADGMPVDAGSTRAAVFSLLDNIIGSRQAIIDLTTLKHTDEAEFEHAVNVCVLSLMIASGISTDTRFLNGLGVGALLHDVGKLEAAGDSAGGAAADPEQHPVAGAFRAARMPGLDRSAIVVIYEHHQGADGSGYPASAPGHRQSLAARIVAVADAYDRLTASGEPASLLGRDQALAELSGRAGRDLDRDIVGIFASRLVGAADEPPAERQS